MMTIFINRIWCVKVDPFVGITGQNVDKPKRRQPKRRQTETHTEMSTDQNVDRLKRRQTKPNQNVNMPKHGPTKNVDIQNVDRPKRG